MHYYYNDYNQGVLSCTKNFFEKHVQATGAGTSLMLARLSSSKWKQVFSSQLPHL